MAYTILLECFMAWLVKLVVLSPWATLMKCLRYFWCDVLDRCIHCYGLALCLHECLRLGGKRYIDVMADVELSLKRQIARLSCPSDLCWSSPNKAFVDDLLYHVDITVRVLTRAVLFHVFNVMLFCLVNIGSLVALSVFISPSTVGLHSN